MLIIVKDNTQKIYNEWIKPGLKTGMYFAMLFCFNHLVFWSIEQLHYRWCTGSGLYGFLQSMMTNQSGMCKALRQVSEMASSSSSNALYAIVTVMSTKLYYAFKNDETPELYSEQSSQQKEADLQS